MGLRYNYAVAPIIIFKENKVSSISSLFCLSFQDDISKFFAIILFSSWWLGRQEKFNLKSYGALCPSTSYKLFWALRSSEEK